MRIKLRLYPRELDMIALKQNQNFEFGPTLRQLLCEYAETGTCKAVYIPDPKTQTIIVRQEQVNFELKNEKAMNWLLGIKPGMRNAAIKTILRMSIANPPMWVFSSECDLIFPESSQGRPVRTKASPNIKSNHEPEAQCDNDSDIPNKQLSRDSFFHNEVDCVSTGSDGMQEMDLLDFEFENY